MIAVAPVWRYLVQLRCAFDFEAIDRQEGSPAFGLLSTTATATAESWFKLITVKVCARHYDHHYHHHHHHYHHHHHHQEMAGMMHICSGLVWPTSENVEAPVVF